MRRIFTVLVAAALVAGLGACGDDDGDAAPEATSTTTGEEVTPAALVVTGTDYAFDVPATIPGGLVEMTFVNAGAEPHFAAFARVAEGAGYGEVAAILSAPPPDSPPEAPPPFEEYAAAASIDPGVRGNATFNLPPGTYALFCSFPAPDGVPHAAKGMISEVTVTEGTTGPLPEALGVMVADDFALSAPPELSAGASVLGLNNRGKQIHEIDLVELTEGKTVDDVVAWVGQPTGPPPMRILGGVAVKPGEQGTTEVELLSGGTYAFICVIPDTLGDFAPHVTKGMYTEAFTVS